MLTPFLKFQRTARLGLGLAALGRPGYINLGHADDLAHDYDRDAMERHCHAVLDFAWEQGIRYFDAARSYGDAEAFLGSWLRSRSIAPNLVTVGSKWGYTYTAGWRVDAEKHEVKDHTLPVLRRQYAESRERLGRYLDLYQIHSATLDSGVFDNREVIDELRRLRGEGLKIGLSVSGPTQADAIRRAIDLNLFDCVQATWNLLEPSAGPALADAHAAGLGVIVKEGLANGRLTSRNVDPSFAKKCRELDHAAQRLGCTIDALALAACLAQPWVDVVLSGAATCEHLASNLAAAKVTIADDLKLELTQLAETPAEYWATRGRLAWN